MTDLCREVDAVADELALGLLTGEERATVLAHLEECHECRMLVAGLTEVAEAVLLVAPAEPPPPGFETRVLARIAAEAGPPVPADAAPVVRLRRRPARVRALLAAAAVVLAIAVAAVAWSARSTSHTVTATMADAGGNRVGRVSLVSDHGTTVKMDLPGWHDLLARYGSTTSDGDWLVVTTEDGGRDRFALPTGDASSWQVSSPVARGDVSRVAITDAAGHTWCSASFG